MDTATIENSSSSDPEISFCVFDNEIKKTDLKEYVNNNNESDKSDFETTEFWLRLNLLLN